ncbi:MAG: glycine--tRNA ligase subunit beta, partial [Acidobacteriota bacterium]
MSSEYLFEARFFELPPQRVEKVLKRLTGRLFEDLMGRGLGPAEIVTGMTPRRLMVCLKGLPEVEPEREEQHLGPPLTEAYDGSGGPTDALRGFVGRLGVEMEALTEIKTERGAYLGVVRQVPGRSLAEALGDLVPTVLEELDWWRPLRLSGLSGVVSLLDGEVLPLTVLGTKAGRETTGHPVLSPAPIPVESFADYTEALRRLGLEVVFETRRQQLEEGLVSRASELGGELVADAELLARLTATCEVPGIVHGAFERDHLSLPEEVLLAALSGHSNACAVRGESGLLADFLTVMDRADDPQGKIRRGQERAVAGRLIDARFRYDRDRRIALAERRRLLEALDLHPRLGSYAAKADRIRALVALACSQLGWDDV